MAETLIRLKTDLFFSQTWYLKDDPDQYPHRLVRVIIDPPLQVKFVLSYLGERCEVYDFECSLEPDPSKQYNYDPKQDEE